MKPHIALAGAILILPAFPVLAHDAAHPVAGEHPVEETDTADLLWDLLLPDAEAAANFSIKGAYRYINANGYPLKAPGAFPNRGNPHSIQKKNYRLKVRVNPKKNGRATPIRNQPFGIALNGVLMDPGTAEAWQNNRRSGWNYEAKGGACKLGLDRHNAHVQPDGTYHYHGIPKGLVASSGGSRTPALIGYAADGFPIYGQHGYSDPTRKSGMTKLRSSYAVKSGTRSGGPGGRYNGTFTQDWAYISGRGDLDQCNGRFAVTPEYPHGTYHYVLTDTFPFIPRCWMGTPDGSFSRLKARGEGGQRPQAGNQRQRQRPEAGGQRRGPGQMAGRQGRPPRHEAGRRPPRHLAMMQGGQRPPRGAGQGQRRPQGAGGGNARGPCQGS